MVYDSGRCSHMRYKIVVQCIIPDWQCMNHETWNVWQYISSVGLQWFASEVFCNDLQWSEEVELILPYTATGIYFAIFFNASSMGMIYPLERLQILLCL